MNEHNNEAVSNEMHQLRELSAAIEKLVEIHIETIKQNRDMLAAMDFLIEQNDLLILEVTQHRNNDEERDSDDGYVTLMSGEKVKLK